MQKENMKITPLQDYIHIKKPRPETKTASGIVLLKEETISKFQGTALAIGPDVKQVKVGDVIIYKQFCSHATPEERDEYLVSEKDVIGIKE